MRASVIWISGYSGAGKTTVGRRLDSLLREANIPSVYLDGDELRSILANQWGYERADRIELGRVYFRLCSHLASQGLTVTIAAVAMYDELRQWVKQNIPGAVEVFLDVPQDELLRRDGKTKGIYKNFADTKKLYDDAKSPDLVVRNHGDTSAGDSAKQIFDFIRSYDDGGRADFGREGHWNAYYSNAKAAPMAPSPYAVACADEMKAGGAIIDVGCGNGRDSAYFASKGFSTTGIDPSAQAIALCSSAHVSPNLTFKAGKLNEVPLEKGSLDGIYCRFVLHAMSEQEEDAFIATAKSLLRKDGRLFVECRSINDPMSRKGEVISKTERIFGHYRRFVVKEDLDRKLQAAGFILERSLEGGDLSPLGDDNPVLIRLTARLA
ncbi:MAG TPA: adenylyl-sulfate kinase [Hyphomonadaceae bacterium]|nr:adenylyl-sulfate kinase [Hyphomonadaceae bacterium]HPI47587.1 adenylyl-sulfate kinase [Hyphomonadaceae bacterium]